MRNLLIWDVVMRFAVAPWILEVSVGYSGGVNTSVRMLAPSFVRSVLRLALASSSSVSFLLRIAQWEEMGKTSVSTELSAFKTLS